LAAAAEIRTHGALARRRFQDDEDRLPDVFFMRARRKAPGAKNTPMRIFRNPALRPFPFPCIIVRESGLT
jgi:hypothetical protein